MLTYSVVICTLNRPDDLKRCIISWLNQRPLPKEIIVVHGKIDGRLGDCLLELVRGTGVDLTYICMPPSLVFQRNKGMSMAIGDIIFFADDDAVYLNGYSKAILEVYQVDSKGMIGGVQGTIINNKSAQYMRWGLAKIFLLTRFDGHGSLQSSAWPAYYGDCLNLAQVEVFSGPSMSFRREVLQKFQFNKALGQYWMGDDFEMAYRVSRKYKLFQAPNARLLHYSSPVDRDSIRRQIMMMVVNHYYITKKCFGLRWESWICWIWSEIGLWLLALLWIITGKGPKRFLGMLDGYRELFKSIVCRP